MTTYHTTGTITATDGSTAIAGTLTDWATALISAGVLYVDGGAYPIASVASNTALTLRLPFKGSSGSGKPYAIGRSEAIQEQTVVNANRLADILSTIPVFTTFARQIFDDTDAGAVRVTIGAQAANARLSSLAAVAGGANRLPYLSGENAFSLADLSAFGRSLIDDADAAAAQSTLGLVPQAAVTDTTAGRLLKVGSFGVGKTAAIVSPNLNTVLPTGLYYCNAPTNGPTGANGWLRSLDLDPDYSIQEFIDLSANLYRRIRYAGAWTAWKRDTVEYGANGNGEYWRLENGLQICTRSTSVTTTGGSFSSTGWTYPAAFAAKPFAFMVMEQGSSTDPTTQAVSPAYGAYTATSVTFIYKSPSTVSTIQIAVGRW